MPLRLDVHDPAALGQTLRQLRQQAGLSRDDLAEALSVSPPTITRIERGAEDLPVALLVRLLRTCHHHAALLLVPPEGPAQAK